MLREEWKMVGKPFNCRNAHWMRRRQSTRTGAWTRIRVSVSVSSSLWSNVSKVRELEPVLHEVHDGPDQPFQRRDLLWQHRPRLGRHLPRHLPRGMDRRHVLCTGFIWQNNAVLDGCSTVGDRSIDRYGSPGLVRYRAPYGPYCLLTKMPGWKGGSGGSPKFTKTFLHRTLIHSGTGSTLSCSSSSAPSSWSTSA